MERDVKQASNVGIAVSLQVPAWDPDLFKNKATNDVLSLLSRRRFDEFTIGELARQTSHTKPTVGRAVDTLEANDLVTTDHEGNRRLVGINRERLSVPDDPYLRIPQREFHEPVKAAVEELTDALDDVLGIVLYGSVARGEADRRSDVDLWVLVSEGRAESQRAANAVERDLEDREFETGRYDYDIDIEAVSSLPKYTEAVRDIVVAGITVYETPEFETAEKLLVDEVDGDE
jgi:predicted nucleotidyltransferase